MLELNNSFCNSKMLIHSSYMVSDGGRLAQLTSHALLCPFLSAACSWGPGARSPALARKELGGNRFVCYDLRTWPWRLEFDPCN